MFQRKQSLFLIISLVIGIVSLFVPFGGNETHSLTAFSVAGDGVFEGNPIFGGLGLVLGMLIYAIALIQFSNRKRQMTLIKVGSLFMTLGVFYSIYLISMNKLDVNYLIALPFVAEFLAAVASNFIKKDEDLIKSVDRIR